MKHAILILAYNNFEILNHLVDYFKIDCYVLIHIDKKVVVNDDLMLELKAKSQVVDVYQKFTIHWGGYSILECELFLLKEAIRLTDANYFHLISGQDYPIKPLSVFLRYFDQRNGWEFISYVHIPHKNFQENTYDRFCYYLPYDLFDDKCRSTQFVQCILKWQKKLKIKRSIPNEFDHLYGGSQWFSITRVSVIKILDHTKRFPKFYKRLRFTFAPEEVYIVTLIVNLMPKYVIMNNNLRFIRWKYENGNIPANLSIEHFHLLTETDAFFARKVSKEVSNELINVIDTYLLFERDSDNLKNGWEGFSDITYDTGLVEAIYKYCIFSKIKYGVDCGCGSGIYVAALRRLGLKFTGFDLNINVEKYSKLLLPKNDTLCFQGDLANEITTEDFFEIALCINVFQYLPHEKLYRAIDNLLKLTNNTIVTSWNQEFENYFLENQIELYINKYGFEEDLFATSFFKSYLKKINFVRVFRFRKEVK